MKNIAFLVSGSGTNMQAVLEEIDRGNINGKPCVVISTNDTAYALTRARERNIDTFVFRKTDFESGEMRDLKIIEVLKKYQIDLVICAGYLGIISAYFVQQFRNKIINIHPSLLPRHGGIGYYGIRVHEEVLRLKEPITGATAHFVDEGVDEGQIIMQKSVAVDPSDTAEILQKKVLNNCEYFVLCEAVRLFCDDLICQKNGTIFIDKKQQK